MPARFPQGLGCARGGEGWVRATRAAVASLALGHGHSATRIMPPTKKKGRRKEAKPKDAAQEGETPFVPKRERRLQQHRKSAAKRRGSTKYLVRPLLLHR